MQEVKMPANVRRIASISKSASSVLRQAPSNGAQSKAIVPARRSKEKEGADSNASDLQYPPAELEFMRAMQEYKQKTNRMFPTWSEVLEVLQGLGYQKRAPGGIGQGERTAEPGKDYLNGSHDRRG
jgi:hypothetical protein